MMMTKSSSLNSLVGPERTWDKGRGRNTRYRLLTKSKSLNKQIRTFKAALASDEKEDATRKNQDSKAKLKHTKPVDELYENGNLFESAISSDDVHSRSRKEDDFDPDCGYEGRWTPLEPYPLLDPMFRADNQEKPSAIRTTDEQPRIDFQRYHDIIEKITVNHMSPGDPEEVNIKFEDETLDGARVVITKNGDKIKIRWQTSSGSVYRMLTKQRFQLQQHVYSHLGIKSDVSVDFKKALKPRSAPRSARQKNVGRSMQFKTSTG